jgi:hypothetical protein
MVCYPPLMDYLISSPFILLLEEKKANLFTVCFGNHGFLSETPFSLSRLLCKNMAVKGFFSEQLAVC